MQLFPGDLVQIPQWYLKSWLQVYGIVISVDSSQYSAKILYSGNIIKAHLTIAKWKKIQ